MSDLENQRYEETIMCEAREDEGLLFIKVVAMPYRDPGEFNTGEAKAFAQRILDGVARIEAAWGK